MGDSEKDNPEVYVVGDLVRYIEYFYYPGIPTASNHSVQNNDIGIVISEVNTVYGNTLYDVYWLRANLRCYTARLNLKLAYLKKRT